MRISLNPHDLAREEARKDYDIDKKTFKSWEKEAKSMYGKDHDAIDAYLGRKFGESNGKIGF